MSYRSYLLPKLRDQLVGQGMNEILPGLYIGNFRDSKDCKQLDVNRITHILSIHDDAKKLFKEKKYLIICAADSPKQDLTQYLPQCNDFIHAARLRGGHVLIHCLAGISRSVTIAAAYITCVTSLNHQEALQVIRSSRKVANPNSGFQKQLGEFESSGAVQKERARLAEKFRPRPVVVSGGSPSPSCPATPRRPGSAESSNPVSPSSGPASSRQIATAVPGRLYLRMTTMSYEVTDSLATDDEEKCRHLLHKYRQLVTKGDLCGGDCPNDGMSCSSGVCRAHLRTATSFLRRGTRKKSTSAGSRQQQQQQHWNVWSIASEDQIRWSNTTTSITTTTTATPSRGMSRSQPVSPAPRTPSSKLSVGNVRRPSSSDGLRHVSATNLPESPILQSPRRNGNIVTPITQPSRGDVATQSLRTGASRPLFKVKSDSSLPASPSSMQRHPKLRHRVTINGIPPQHVASSNPSSAPRSLSTASLIPAIAPLADIAEHSTDIDLNRIQINHGESVTDHQRRRFENPPMMVINDGRKSLSMTKISEKPIFLSEQHSNIRRNASWTTMTTALNS